MHSTVQIARLSHEGWGIGESDGGRVAFVQGALPGETVRYHITERKNRHIKGVCLQVLANPHPDRVLPPCSHYSVCGGCSLQHLSSQAQLSVKQQILAEQLARAQVEVGAWQPALCAETSHYRHKARLSVRYVDKKGGALVGFRERLKGRFLADIESCHILAQPVATLIRPLRDLIGQLLGARTIAQIEVAVTEDTTALVLRHLAPLADEDVNQLRAFAKQHSVCWYLQSGGPSTIHPLDPQQPAGLHYEVEGIDIDFLPQDFTQINPQLNQMMVKQALSWLNLSGDDTVLDLFCGLGNFSLPLAKHAAAVVGVEGCEAMVERAGVNAANNGLSNVRFFAHDLFKAPPDTALWLQPTYQKLLLDPPRAGAEMVCNNVAYFGVDAILYVSCSMVSFVRDAQILDKKGYCLKKIGIMDMFPHTGHTETMAWFTKESHGKGQRRSDS